MLNLVQTTRRSPDNDCASDIWITVLHNGTVNAMLLFDECSFTFAAALWESGTLTNGR